VGTGQEIENWHIRPLLWPLLVAVVAVAALVAAAAAAAAAAAVVHAAVVAVVAPSTPAALLVSASARPSPLRLAGWRDFVGTLSLFVALGSALDRSVLRDFKATQTGDIGFEQHESGPGHRPLLTFA
jgi:hypothetical protein